MLRESRFWSQEELAERAGVSRATIYKAEGGAGVAPKTGRALAQALGVSSEELLRPLKPKSYGGAMFEHYLARAQQMPPEELWERGRELDRRVDELARDPRGQASAEELRRYFRELTESVNELRAIAEVLNERAKRREATLAKV